MSIEINFLFTRIIIISLLPSRTCRRLCLALYSIEYMGLNKNIILYDNDTRKYRQLRAGVRMYRIFLIISLQAYVAITNMDLTDPPTPISVNELDKLTTKLKCFVLKNIRVDSRTCGEWAPSCLLSQRCSSSTRVTIYSVIRKF